MFSLYIYCRRGYGYFCPKGGSRGEGEKEASLPSFGPSLSSSLPLLWKKGWRKTGTGFTTLMGRKRGSFPFFLPLLSLLLLEYKFATASHPRQLPGWLAWPGLAWPPPTFQTFKKGIKEERRGEERGPFSMKQTHEHILFHVPLLFGYENESAKF